MKKAIITLAIVFVLLPLVFGSWNSSLNEGLVAYWTFDENAGSVAKDNISSYDIVGLGGGGWHTPGVYGSNYQGVLEDLPQTNFSNNVSNGGGQLSWNFWINTSATSIGVLFDNHAGAGQANNGWNRFRTPASGTFDYYIYDSVGYKFTSESINNDVYQMITILINSSDYRLFVNGTNIANKSLNAWDTSYSATYEFLSEQGAEKLDNTDFDEMGLWNKTLSLSNIIELFNGGIGSRWIPNKDLFDVSTTLLLPSNGNIVALSSDAIDFSASISAENSNITNATISLWDSSHTLINHTTNNVSGISNITNFSISNLDIGGYIWNVYSCAENSTTGICRSQTENFTFQINPFSVDSEFFNNNVYETDDEYFSLNITTIPSILSVSADLSYNGTEYPATTSCNASGFCNIVRVLDIPLISSNDEGLNMSFFWNVSVFDGSQSLSLETSTQEQNVSRIHLEDCNATWTTRALNFTSYDEQSQERINPYYISGTLQSWFGTGTVSREESYTNTSGAELDLCISPVDKDFTLKGQFEYNDVINSSKYNTRNYFFDQDIVNNATQDIKLLLLNVDESTSFILKVQDENLLPVEGALIYTQRLDLSTGNFTTVQVGKTDENGQTVGFFKTETVDYRFIIKKNGETLLTTNSQKVVPESSPFTLTFTVGVTDVLPWELFTGLDNLTSSLVYSPSTGNFTFGYEDTDQDFSLGRLTLTHQNASSFGTVVCDVNTTLTSASLVCGTSGVNGTFIASGYITRGSNTFLVEQEIVSKLQYSIKDEVGNYGIFLAFFIILVSVFVFRFNEIAGIVAMNFAVIAVNIFGLVSFGWLFIFGMIAVSLIIIVMWNR